MEKDQGSGNNDFFSREILASEHFLEIICEHPPFLSHPELMKPSS